MSGGGAVQEALTVIGFLVGYLIGQSLYGIIKLKESENRKLSYRISDHMSDRVLQLEPPPPILAEGFKREFAGVSIFALSLVFEFYEDLDKEEVKKFFSKVLLEFIKDLQENEEEFRKLAKTKFVVEYTQPLWLFGFLATSPKKWLFVDVSRDYIEWLTKTYGIEKDEIMNIAVVSHMLKTRGKRVVVKVASYLDAMEWSPY